MVVIGRGKGEVLHNAADAARTREQETRYADNDTVMRLASDIADRNSELMRRLA